MKRKNSYVFLLKKVGGALIRVGALNRDYTVFAPQSSPYETRIGPFEAQFLSPFCPQVGPYNPQAALFEPQASHLGLKLAHLNLTLAH